MIQNFVVVAALAANLFPLIPSFKERYDRVKDTDEVDMEQASAHRVLVLISETDRKVVLSTAQTFGFEDADVEGLKKLPVYNGQYTVRLSAFGVRLTSAISEKPICQPGGVASPFFGAEKYADQALMNPIGYQGHFCGQPLVQPIGNQNRLSGQPFFNPMGVPPLNNMHATRFFQPDGLGQLPVMGAHNQFQNSAQHASTDVFLMVANRHAAEERKLARQKFLDKIFDNLIAKGKPVNREKFDEAASVIFRNCDLLLETETGDIALIKPGFGIHYFYYDVEAQFFVSNMSSGRFE